MLGIGVCAYSLGVGVGAANGEYVGCDVGTGVNDVLGRGVGDAVGVLVGDRDRISTGVPAG